MKITIKYSHGWESTITGTGICLSIVAMSAIIGGIVAIKNELVRQNLYSKSIIYSMPFICAKGIIGMIIGAGCSILSPIMIPAFVWYKYTHKPISNPKCTDDE